MQLEEQPLMEHVVIPMETAEARCSTEVGSERKKMPVLAIVVIVVAALALVGSGVGFAIVFAKIKTGGAAKTKAGRNEANTTPPPSTPGATPVSPARGVSPNAESGPKSRLGNSVTAPSGPGTSSVLPVIVSSVAPVSSNSTADGTADADAGVTGSTQPRVSLSREELEEALRLPLIKLVIEKAIKESVLRPEAADLDIDHQYRLCVGIGKSLLSQWPEKGIHQYVLTFETTSETNYESDDLIAFKQTVLQRYCDIVKNFVSGKFLETKEGKAKSRFSVLRTMIYEDPFNLETLDMLFEFSYFQESVLRTPYFQESVQRTRDIKFGMDLNKKTQILLAIRMKEVLVLPLPENHDRAQLSVEKEMSEKQETTMDVGKTFRPHHVGSIISLLHQGQGRDPEKESFKDGANIDAKEIYTSYPGLIFLCDGDIVLIKAVVEKLRVLQNYSVRELYRIYKDVHKQLKSSRRQKSRAQEERADRALEVEGRSSSKGIVNH